MLTVGGGVTMAVLLPQWLYAIGQWLGRSLNGTLYPLTLGVGAFSVGVAGVTWTLVQRHGEPSIAARVVPT